MIQLISPSRWADEALISYAETLIISWGFRSSRGKHVGARWGQLGGTDEQRSKDFLAAWLDDGVSAIWALRGGYGAQRILNYLPDILIPSSKPYVGFSDSTAIHGYLQYQGYCSIHAAMPSTASSIDKPDLDALRTVLSQGPTNHEFECAIGDVFGVAQGRLIGGNLSVLQTMVATPSFQTKAGDILFIEDIDEMLYHVDRMLLHLERTGILAKLGGILVGGMTDLRDNTTAFGFSQDNPFGMNTHELLSNRLDGLGIPVAMRYPAGHDNRNHPLLLGAQVELIVSRRGNLLNYR